ncbi:uncharacterized protein YbaR (Trm112 family) [Lachnospiraceae bacterium PF1-22]
MEIGLDCPHCENPLVVVMAKEEEIRDGFYTGRTREIGDYILCENCGFTSIVDGSFDGAWGYERK